MALADNIQYTRTVEEYKKTGLPYRISAEYANAQRFFNKTKNSKVDIIEIRNCQRIRDASGKEWLNWQATHRREDGWENLKGITITDMGISKRGIPEYGGKYDDEGNLVRKITGTKKIEEVFNTEYSVDNCEKLHKFSVPPGSQNPTLYTVKEQYDSRDIVCKTYEDWRDGNFEDLKKTGKKADSSKVAKKGAE